MGAVSSATKGLVWVRTVPTVLKAKLSPKLGSALLAPFSVKLAHSHLLRTLRIFVIPAMPR